MLARHPDLRQPALGLDPAAAARHRGLLGHGQAAGHSPGYVPVLRISVLCLDGSEAVWFERIRIQARVDNGS